MKKPTKAQQKNNEARQRLVAALGWEPEDQTCAAERYAQSTGELWSYVAELFGAERANALRSGGAE